MEHTPSLTLRVSVAHDSTVASTLAQLSLRSRSLLLKVERTLHHVGLIAEVLGVPAIGALLNLASCQIRQTLVFCRQSQLDCNLLLDVIRHDGYFNQGAKHATHCGQPETR